MDAGFVFEKIINYEDAVYDSFVYNHQKIVVLKEDLFGTNYEYVDEDVPENSKRTKRLFLGVLVRDDSCDLILPLDVQEYDETAEYYIELKRSFLKER